jgi:tetratricopeptide (TPR) repeat protein
MKNNKNKLILRKNISRKNSLKILLSNLSWERGIGNFFIEDVPFSYSTGKSFAAKLTNLIEYFSELTPNKKTYLYELGAGLGILSKNILDLIKTKKPDLYKNILLNISDSSPTIVDHFTRLNIFEKHLSKTNLQLANAANPAFNINQKPKLTYMTYVYDSLPARHIEIDNKEIFEIRITETIDKDEKIFNSTVFPPKLINAQEIKSLLQDEYIKLLPIVSKLTNIIQEEHTKFHIDKITDISSEEKKELLEFVETIDNLEPFQFNYSYELGVSLRKIIKQMPNESGFLTLDFGTTKPLPIKKDNLPIISFGAVSASPVFFPYIQYIAKQENTHCFITDNTQGHNQVLLIYKGNSPENTKKVFDSNFNDINKSNQAFSTIESIKKNKDYYLSDPNKIENLIKKLPKYDQESYYLVINIATILYNAKQYKKALYYTELSLKSYKAIAIPSYLLLGKIYSKLDDTNNAITHLKKALEISKVYADAYNELGIILCEKKAYSQFLSAAKQYLRYCQDDNNIWNHIIMMSIFNTYLKNEKEAKEILDWINMTAVKAPKKVPISILIKAGELNKAPKL